MGYPGDHGAADDRAPDRATPAEAFGAGPRRPLAAPHGTGGEAPATDDPFGATAPFDGRPASGPTASFGAPAASPPTTSPPTTGTPLAPPFGAPGDGFDGGFDEGLGTPVAGQATRTQRVPSGGFTGGVPDGPESGGPAEPPAFGGFGHPDDAPVPAPGRPSGRGRTPLVVAGSAAAGLVLVAAGFFGSSMLKSDDDKPAPRKAAAQTATRPTAKVTPTVPPLEPVKLRSRATDPKPLTLREAFGKKSFTGGGQKYLRTAVRSGSCAAGVTGAAFVAALKKAGCSQGLRATYARKDGKLIGTVGVLNLRSEKAARYAAKAAAAKSAHLTALPGTGVTAKNGKGEALGSAQVKGHYLVLTWVQRPDGKKIAAAYDKVVAAFGQQVVKSGGLGFALAYRETEGKPFNG
ncbi:hypothetical protein [Actinomadura atramentaria]|uniref:hypothetical protein n=1 Tax=Actinomadura atramentaria TaxID=1990 RepID=UPI000382881B|nr:hypothetical protein [Actinomadura atramentaria]